MKPSSFFHSTTWNRSFLSLLLVILSLGVFAQTNELVRYDFGMFSILFPESCQKIETESDEEQGCSGWVTPNKDFICTVCFFGFDEGFDPEQRFREEAEGLNINLDKSERFMITTGTEQVLQCALIQRSANSYLAIGLYPDLKQKKGVFLCMMCTNAEKPALLAYVMSSFRIGIED